MALTTVQSGMLNADSQNYGFKNRIINGAMVISQRNGTSSVSETGAGQYTLDRWQVAGASPGVFSVAQSTTAPTGFINSLLITVTTADASLTGASYQLQQKIEGLNVTDLGWGTASAQNVTLSFWVRSSLYGTFGGAITNSNYDWTYPFNYSISSANTWEQKSVTITAPTSGTWLTTNGNGIQLVFGLGAQVARKATAGVWANTVARQPTGSVDLIASSGATFYITGVQLEKGSVATQFDYRPYGTEQLLCLRYYQDFRNTSSQFGATLINPILNSADRIAIQPGIIPMRTTPTITAYSTGGSSGFLTEFSSGTNRTVSGVNQNGPMMGSGYYQLTASATNPVYTNATYSAEL